MCKCVREREYAYVPLGESVVCAFERECVCCFQRVSECIGFVRKGVRERAEIRKKLRKLE